MPIVLKNALTSQKFRKWALTTIQIVFCLILQFAEYHGSLRLTADDLTSVVALTSGIGSHKFGQLLMDILNVPRCLRTSIVI